MTDWHRMEWQYRLNRFSEWTQVACAVAIWPEVFAVLKYHFPLWDEIAIPITLGVFVAARLIHKYTKMYRFDL